MRRAADFRFGRRSALGLAAAAVVACVGCGKPISDVPRADPRRNDGARQAPVRGPAPARWFHDQRAGTLGTTPVRIRSRAVEAARASGLTVAPGSWVGGGPRNVGGRVTALGVDPNDPARIWVGTAAGGVFLTEDEGATFRPVFDDQTALSIGSLVVHPTDSNTVYVGTGEDNGAGYVYDGEGVFKTVDGGRHWANMGLAEVRRIGRMAIDPTNGNRVYAAAGGDWYRPDRNRGIYRSVDGGQSWQQVLFVGEDAGGIDIVMDPGNPSRLFASIWQRSSDGTHWHIGGPLSGIYRTLDGGDTWVRLTAGLPTVDMGKIGLAIAPSDPRVIYANIISPIGTLQGIYRSTTGGDTWEKRSNNGAADWYGGAGYYFAGIRVDPDDAKTTYSLDIHLLRSTNGGRSVGPAEGPVHADWHDLIIDASRRWIAGTDGGVDISRDDGSTWTHAVALPITQFYDLGIDTLDPRRRFGGSQDTGTLRTATGGVDDWGEVLTNDGLQCEVDPTESSKVYASMQAGDLYRSVDGGDNFVRATDGIDTTEPVNWNAPLALDPAVPSTIYTGRSRVYRSTDSMVSWSPVSPDLTGPTAAGDPGASPASGRAHGEGPVRGTISVVAVSPVNHDVLWAGTADGNVWVSDDAGVAWVNVNPPGLSYWVTDIAPDPVEANTAYVTVTGYRLGDRLPYARVTRDLGATWTDITGNLPEVPVNCVLADTDWRGRLLVGTDVGVYVSDDAGGSWSDMRSGMPYVVVLDLVRHDPTDTLFAATHGRSIYAFDLAQLGPADGDADGVDNNTDCAPADPGAFAPPGEVAELTVDRVAGPTSELRWTGLASGAGAGTIYDLARGDVVDLTASGGTAGAGPLGCGVTGTSYTDPTAPPAGGFYYLARGRNACGIGSWGEDSSGSTRAPAACP